jgi:hypothetical protein
MHPMFATDRVRSDIGEHETVYMTYFDPEDEFTEVEWEALLKEQRHELTNVAGPKVDSLHKAWRGANDVD